MQAQSGAGTIQGSVLDITSAAIPNAGIVATSKATGQTISTTANETGFYLIPSLFAGEYTLTFSAPGMKRAELDVILRVGQTATISATLSPGSVTEAVVVQAEEVPLATYDGPTISSTLENSRINQLPINGRNILTLTQLTTPGLEAGGTRANGNLAGGIEYVQDGVPLTNQNIGGPTRLPDPDSIQEVRMETLNSSAQFATPATGILTTKSGTSQLHGTFFETARNNYIGIAKSRSDRSDLKAPHLVRNEFGASLGGPVVLPKIYDGRGRTFFFAAYERYSLRSFTTQLVSVPTVAMRNGDFSNAVQGNVAVNLYDSQTTDTQYQRQRFSNNQIPISRQSPLAKTLYAITPLPSSNDNPYVQPNLSTPGINNSTAPTFTARLDHRLSEASRAYLRYTWANPVTVTLRSTPYTSPATVAGAGLPAQASNTYWTPTTVHSVASGYTHVFSPTFISETIVSNQWEGDKFNGGPNSGRNYEQTLGLPNNFGLTGFPQIIGINGTSLIMNFNGTQFAYGGSQIITNIDENLSKTLGRHQMQFGARYRHERLGVSPDQRVDSVNFSNQSTALLDSSSGSNYTALAYTGDQNADLFLGAAASYTVNLQEQYLHYKQQELDSYFQDNFHLLPSLTFNIGIRWEIHPAPSERNRQNNGFDFENKAIVLGQTPEQLIARGATTQAVITNLQNLGVRFETPQQAGLPDTMVFDSNFVFSPRLGVAYTPFGSRWGTVLRGGFGRYAYTTPLRNFYASQSTNAPYQFSYSRDYRAANQSPDGLPSYLLRAKQSVVAGLNSSGVIDTASTNAILPGISETILNPHYPPNLVSQGNVTLEQPIKGNSVLRISYIYNHGTNLDQLNNINSHPSTYVYEKTYGITPPTGKYASVATGPYDQTTYGNVIRQDRNGISNDNALQVNFQRLYKNGYAFQAFYVFSRAFRIGGNTFRDSNIYPVGNYAPGLAPVSTQGLQPWQSNKDLNRFQNYQIDSAIPKHHISFNGVVDLPFGRKKRFLGNASRWLDTIVGGFQIAGDGNIFSQYFQPSSSNWGATNTLKVYKHGRPVTDCRSGVCRKAYQYFNGYLAPASINTTNGIQGLSADYLPYQSPINVTPGTANYLTNNVSVVLANGQTVTTSYSPGPALNPYSHTYLLGPFNYTVDLSLFKVIQISEKTSLRLNVDAFNALNVQGFVNPNSSDGIEQITSSYNTPRQLQFTARFTF